MDLQNILNDEIAKAQGKSIAPSPKEIIKSQKEQEKAANKTVSTNPLAGVAAAVGTGAVEGVKSAASNAATMQSINTLKQEIGEIESARTRVQKAGTYTADMAQQMDEQIALRKARITNLIEAQRNKNAASNARLQAVDERYELGRVGEFAQDLGSAAGNMAPSLGIGLINPAAGLASFGVQAAAQSYGQALDEGATHEQAVRYGVSTGLKEAAIEKLTGGLGRFYGKGLIGNAVKNDSLKNVALNTLKGAAGEGAEEAISGAIDPYLQRATYNPEAENASAEELAYQAAIGAALGGILGGGSNVLDYRVNKGTKKAAQGAEMGAQQAQTQSTINNTTAEKDGLKGEYGASISPNEGGFQGSETYSVSQKPDTQTDNVYAQAYEEMVTGKGAAEKKALTEDEKNVKRFIQSAAIGARLEVKYEDLPTSRRAYYADGVLHINKNKLNEGMKVTAAHEIYHALEGTKEHEAVVELAIKARGGDAQSLIAQKIAEYAKAGVTLDEAGARAEIGAEFIEKAMSDEATINRVLLENRTLAQRILQWVKDMLSVFEKRKTMSAEDLAEYKALLKARQLYEQGLAKLREGKYEPAGVEREARYKLVGRNKDGIEIYETSEEIKKLPYSERKKEFLRIMREDYAGRTARFVANGKKYYARFDEDDLQKNIYGDNKSSQKGYNAKINVGASGDIFDLVENAKYYGSKTEKGKKNNAHNSVQNWDYFIKQVQIDGNMYDLLANVRKKNNSEYVYSIQLNESKKVEASPHVATQNNSSVKIGGQHTPTVDNNIPNSAENVNSKSAENEKNISQGRFAIESEQNMKEKQFAILQKANPMTDDYHVGIRKAEDIKTWAEAMEDEESFVWGDFSREDAQRALEKGSIKVYSSRPIEQGSFISTSYNQARDYAGGGKVYEKTIKLEDAAWINGDEGQFVGNSGERYAIDTDSRYGDLIDQYGAMDKGMEPRVDVDVPKQTSDEQSIIEKLQENKQKISSNGIVSTIKGTEFQGLWGRDLVNAVSDSFAKLDNKVYRKGLGEVTLSRNTVRDSISHGIGEMKAAAFAAVPDVIEKGIAIDMQSNWKNRGYDTYVIGGEVLIGDKITQVGVVLKKGPDYNKFYLHEVYFENKKGESDIVQLGSRNNQLYPSNSGVSPNYSILDDGQNVNSEDIRYAIDTDSRYGDLIDQYGVMDKGMDPRVDVDVPRQTNEWDKTRRFTRTAMESENVSDEAKEAIADDLAGDIASGRFTYEPTSNEKLQEKANASIARNGYEGAKQGIFKKYRDNEAFKAEDVALLEQLIVKASAEGRTQDAVDMIGLAAMVGTEMGQSVQALSMLKRMTPEGRLKQMELLRDRLNTKYGLTGEKQVEINERYKRMLLNKDNTAEDIENVQSYIIDDMAKQLPVSLKDKFDAWRYLAMLGNPRTHIRNTVGNAMNLTISRLNDQLAGIVEANLLKEGQRTRAAGTVSRELKEFARQDWETDGKYRTDMSNKYGERGQAERNKQIFKTKGLESLRKFNENALDAEDTLFKKKQYTYALSHYMKANNITPAEMEQGGVRAEAARKFAEDEAYKVTFQEYNALANALNRFENKKTDSKLEKTGQMAVKALMPFKRTPLNILKRGVEYSPVGLANGLSDMYKLLRKGEGNAAAVITEITQGMTGSGIVVLGYFLAEMGVLTAGYDEENKRRQNYENQLGGQNYAITLPGGGTYTLDWAAPVVMPLFVGAAVYDDIVSRTDDDGAKSGLLQSVLHGLVKVTDPVLEMSCMDSLQSALESYGNEGATSNMIVSAAKSYLMQFVPTLSGQIARTIDETKRSTYAPSDSPYTKTGESLGRQFMNKVPGLSYSSEPALDVWGREREQAGGNIVGRAALNMLSPGTYAPNKETMADREIKRLYDALGEDKVIPKTAAKYVTKKIDNKNRTFYLTAKEYTAFQKKYGQDNFKAVSELMRSSVYKKMSDADKAEAIAEIYDYNGKAAKSEFFKGRKVVYDEAESMKKTLAESGGWVGYFEIKQAFPDQSYETAKKRKETCDRYGIDYTAYSESDAKISELKSINSARYEKAGDKTEANKRDIARYLASRRDLTDPQRQVLWEEIGNYKDTYKQTARRYGL